MEFFKASSNYNFMGLRKAWYGLSALLVAVVLSIGASGFSPALLAVLLLTTLFAAVGTRFARRNARPVVKA